MAKILKFKYISKVNYPVQVGKYWLSPNASFIIEDDVQVNPKEVYKKEV